LDHSKYNVDQNQLATVNGTITTGTQPNGNGQLSLTEQDFYYALHNGLNHLMINAVWLKHLDGPTDKQGELQLISRAGAGILLPHADNIILGNDNQVGPKNQNMCCFTSNDWWQVNGWTAGVEVGLRYRVYKSMFPGAHAEVGLRRTQPRAGVPGFSRPDTLDERTGAVGWFPVLAAGQSGFSDPQQFVQYQRIWRRW